MRYTYIPQGICPDEIILTLDGDTVQEVEFVGGCDGNLKAMSRLVRGMKAADLTKMLSGLTCDDKETSCGDQLSKAVLAAVKSATQAQ